MTATLIFILAGVGWQSRTANSPGEKSAEKARAA